MSHLTQQVLIGGSSTVLNNTNLNWLPIQNGVGPAGANSQEAVTQVIPVAGTIKKWMVQLDGAPGTAGSGRGYTFTLRVNNVSIPASTITIEDTATEGEYIGDIDLAVWDYITIRVVPVLIPLARRTRTSAIFQPDALTQTIILGGAEAVGGATLYSPISGQGGAANNSSNQNDARQVFPTNGTLTNWYIQLDPQRASPGSGKSFTWEIYVNGIASGKSITIGGSAYTGSETSTNISISAGDIITVKRTAVGVPQSTTANWGIIFVPIIVGEWVLLGGISYDLSDIDTLYNHPSSGVMSSVWRASENQSEQYYYPALIGKLIILLSTAPGAGKSYTFTLRLDNADTVVAVTISGTDTTGSTPLAKVVSAIGSIALECTPLNTPAVANVYWGFSASGIPAIPPVGSYGVLLGD